MRKYFVCLYLCLACCWACDLHAQDFSNKGKDFWVGYGYHVKMANGNTGSQQMVLYFATESVTNVTVSIPGLGYSVTYPNIPANTIFTSNPLPKTGAQDARLTSEGTSAKGIHITSDKPIVAYAHIYDGNISGATLLFPTNTLGKEYYSVNYDQVSNENQSNCWFYAVAVDTGTTVVQITPSGNTLTHVAATPFTVSLKQGEVINVMGQLIRTADPFTGVDLTGSTIKSISSGTGGCKRIAVFSGSGKLSITCNNNSASADNYIVQAFPKTAWGKRYLTAPTKNFPTNYFRVCVTDPATIVKVNGIPLSGLRNNFFYQFSGSTASLIEADKPILVAQYISSQNACGNGNPGDPEVIYLSPVEQNIDRVILNSTPNFAISQHFINVVIKASAAGSFRLDGAVVSGFQPHPQDATYAFAQLSVGAGKHSLQADSGFNAIAYGYGPAESYGYNAGTNVKDLYQFASVQNEFATVNVPLACKNSPFFFSMTFPYQPTKVTWQFGQALNAMGLQDVTILSPQYDSTWMVNDKQLYRYKLPTAYAITTTGTYPIRILAENPTPEGCSGEQEIDYDLQVFERPVAKFGFVGSGCITDSVQFADSSALAGRSSTQWFWSFGDGESSNLHNPAHLFKAAGSFPVKFSLISDIGCLSDTAVKTVSVSVPPVAKFGVVSPTCVGNAVGFADSSFSQTGNLVKWTWDFGDGSPKIVATNAGLQTHIYKSTGNFTVTLQVENAGGCSSLLFSKNVTIAPKPVVNFVFGKACLPSAEVAFTNQTTIPDGTENQLLYSWTFGDGSSAAVKDPLHSYQAVGPFTAQLVVTSNAGCKDSSSKVVNTVYEQPVAAFAAPAEICLGAVANVTDQSTVSNSNLSAWEWDFGDGTPVATQQNPSHTYSKPGTYTVALRVTSAVGCTSAVMRKTIVVNPLPVADFTLASPTCEKGSVAFTNTSVAKAGNLSKWTWDFGDGGATGSQPSPTHVYTQAGNYTVKLQVETDKGCVSPVVSKDIAIHPLPNVGFVVPGNCINDPTTIFTDTSTIADGSQAQFSWTWNFGDGNATAANNTATIQNGQHRYTSTGNYNVSLKVTSKDGCSATKTDVFTLNGAVPVPAFSLQNSVPLCSNDSLVITDNSFVAPGNLVKLEIYWDYNGNPTNKLVVDRPKKGAVYKHGYPVFTTPATKNYHVKLVIYSGVNCLTETDTIIVVKATPAIQFDSVVPVCASVPAFQLAASVTNMTGGVGLFSGKGVTSSGMFSPAAAGAGTQVIRYTYTGPNGCVSVKEQAITVLAVPTVSAGPDKVVLEGGSVVLNGSATGNNLQYLWSPSSGLNNTSIIQPAASPTNDQTYSLTVTSIDGCAASDQVVVKVLKTPSVPNAFSPNGDGVHDKWEIQYLDSYPGATVDIFNRYGQKVFESKGYAKPWDGTVNGKSLPIGTYYYIIDPKNGRKAIAGFVDIIK